MLIRVELQALLWGSVAPLGARPLSAQVSSSKVLLGHVAHGCHSPVDSIRTLGDKMLDWLLVHMSQGLHGILSVIRQMHLGTALAGPACCTGAHLLQAARCSTNCCALQSWPRSNTYNLCITHHVRPSVYSRSCKSRAPCGGLDYRVGNVWQGLWFAEIPVEACR